VIAFLKADREKALGEVVHPTDELPVGEAQPPIRVRNELLLGICMRLPLENLREGFSNVLHTAQDGAYTTARILAGRFPVECTLWATMES
jgi:hypothetical protein